MNVGIVAFRIFESMRMAFDSIRVHKIRAALTILGVSIGMFVVVALAAAIQGLRESIFADLQSAGPTSFFVFRFMPSLKDNEEGRYNPRVTVGEARAIARLPSIRSVTAHAHTWGRFRYGDNDLNGRVTGFSYGWLDAAGCSLIDGRDFTRVEAERGVPNALINERLRDRLFSGQDPIGRVIVVDGRQPLTVIGVYRDNTSLLGKPNRGDPFQNEMVVPLSLGMRTLGISESDLDLTVRPRETFAQQSAIEDVIALLRGMRGLRGRDVNNFAVVTSESLMKIVDSFSGVFFAVAISISAIGLIVGGIGVIAIMTITVTERTREIGIRKALGATQSSILWQFLVEAATLTAAGAAVGLMGGAALAWGVERWTPLPASIPPEAVISALVASAATGMVFGLAPAVRAARLDPVEALRHE
jgi:putative ABC transport system permease protein